jgi:hypothetical protein
LSSIAAHPTAPFCMYCGTLLYGCTVRTVLYSLVQYVQRAGARRCSPGARTRFRPAWRHHSRRQPVGSPPRPISNVVGPERPSRFPSFPRLMEATPCGRPPGPFRRGQPIVQARDREVGPRRSGAPWCAAPRPMRRLPVRSLAGTRGAPSCLGLLPHPLQPAASDTFHRCT